MSTNMNRLFDQIHNVPRIPEVVRTLISHFNDPRIDFNVVAKDVEKEQMIALKVLRLVNSAHFGLSKKVGTIQDAVIMLGMNQLRTLVIASGMIGAVPKLDKVNIKHFWADSFRTASYGKWLAAESQSAPDLAFTAGLINRLGTILIYMGAPDEAEQIDIAVKTGASRKETELKLLGFTSEQVCAELCNRWHFSPELIEAIEQCGDPLAFQSPTPTAIIVHLARYISQSFSEQKGAAGILDGFPFEVAAKQGLTEQFITDKLPEILEIESGLDGLVE